MSATASSRPGIEFRNLLRTGVQYALASNTVRVVRIALITVTIWSSVILMSKSGRLWAAALICALCVFVVTLLGRITLALNNWIDRRFFREAYNAELILSELANSVSTIRDRKALIETISHRVEASLHPASLALLLQHGRAFTVVHTLGTGLREPVSLQQDGSLVRFLRLQNAPAKVYFEDPQSWVNGIPDLERSLLVALNAQVLIPITVESGLAGILSLGPKRSDTRYTRGDLQLLSAVASQTGLALENIRLTENIRDEIARRERLNRELEIAREVQQRLFPQKLPYVQGLDFAGYCRPALGVGGDYYDFIRLDNGCLGIAIGDVSGKGIAAALTMASLQASLRAQLIRPCENLAQMIEIVSRLVYEASSENRYATFFYAQYDPESRTVEYVNAGHNPPILYRQSEGRVKRLENGGTVLGLFERTSYVQDRLQLDSGDILVGFTDGVSEALNAADEEFGEERLIAAIANANSRSAADLITAILADADAFTRGAPQHDDMTLLVVRSR